jgi:hypothetical protein
VGLQSAATGRHRGEQDRAVGAGGGGGGGATGRPGDDGAAGARSAAGFCEPESEVAAELE